MTERAKKLLLLYYKQSRKIKRVSGLPPLTFKAKKAGTLKNYRIYGNTVNGENVGDRTANLIQGSIKNANIGNNGKINTSNEYNLVYAPVVTGESYTISNNNGTNVYAFYNAVPSTETATSYDSNRQIFSTSTITFVSPTTGYIAVRLANTAQDIMINPGSTAVPYEPVGYRVPVTVEGKNLFDGEFLRGYWAIADGNFVSTITWVCTNKFKCKPSTIYTFSFNTLSRWYGFIWYDSNGTLISSSFSQESTAQTLPIIHTATSPANAAYFAVDIGSYPSNSYSILPTDVTNLMLVEGSTPLPFEPYHAPVTTPIYLPEQIKMVGDEAEYVDYKEQKQHRVRKNLVQTIATSQTINDITFTVNANGSVTCNGTNHGNNPIIFELNNPDVVIPEGVYITSGCPAGGSITGGYKIQYFNGSSWNYELGSGSTFTLSGNLKYRSRILISKDVTVTNLTFYPMLRLASIEDDTYEPYIEDTELDVTLPALPTLSDTNTLTVGTEVQPSGVEIKGRIKAAGGD